MPRDAPDYSNVGGMGTLERAQDWTELAVRLGSPKSHDRAGIVLFMDSFEYGFESWEKTEGATGGSVVVTSEKARTKAFCVKMVSGSGANEASQLYRRFPYPELSNYGFESSVIFADTVQYMIWTLALRDGAEEHQFQIMYIPGETQFTATIPGGSSIAVLSDITLDKGYGLFHNIKFVVDFDNLKYIRLIVNEEEVDLSDYEPYTFTHVSNPHLGVTFTLYGDTGDNDAVYIDDVIVTQREPDNP